MIRFGLSEEEVLNLPVDKFELYGESAQRIEASERRNNVLDLTTAIAGSLTGKGLKEHFAFLDKEIEGTE